jgi:hypothetical protein
MLPSGTKGVETAEGLKKDFVKAQTVTNRAQDQGRKHLLV